MEVVKNLQI